MYVHYFYVHKMHTPNPGQHTIGADIIVTSKRDANWIGDSVWLVPGTYSEPN